MLGACFLLVGVGLAAVSVQLAVDVLREYGASEGYRNMLLQATPASLIGLALAGTAVVLGVGLLKPRRER